MAVIGNKGNLSGNVEPQATLWGDPPTSVLIASGGNLQRITNDALTTISSSPTCDMVTKKSGRVIVGSSDSNILHFSGIGDSDNWAVDGESDSIELEVGYKSGGTINGISHLGNDLVVFKTDGSIFRVVGDYPDWSVIEVGRRMFNLGRFSYVQALNDVLFLDRFYGLRRLSSVQEYGDVKAGSFGEKINYALKGEIWDGGKLWYLPSRSELWVKPASGSKRVFVYNFLIEAWSRFIFPAEILSAISSGNDCYISLDDPPSAHSNVLVGVMDRGFDSDLGTEDIRTEIGLRVFPASGASVMLDRFTADVLGTGEVRLMANDTELLRSNKQGRIQTLQRMRDRELFLRVVSDRGVLNAKQIVVEVGDV